MGYMRLSKKHNRSHRKTFEQATKQQQCLSDSTFSYRGKTNYFKITSAHSAHCGPLLLCFFSKKREENAEVQQFDSLV